MRKMMKAHSEPEEKSIDMLKEVEREMKRMKKQLRKKARKCSLEQCAKDEKGQKVLQREMGHETTGLTDEIDALENEPQRKCKDDAEAVKSAGNTPQFSVNEGRKRSRREDTSPQKK